MLSQQLRKKTVQKANSLHLLMTMTILLTKTKVRKNNKNITNYFHF